MLRILATLLLVISLNAVVQAQSSSSSTVQEGRPAGSYDLSGFDNVNLFNGHLNFSLPLLKIGGRGEAGFTISYVVDTRWTTAVGYDGQCPVYYSYPTGGGSVSASFGELEDATTLYEYVEASDPGTTCNPTGYLPTRAVVAFNLVMADGTRYKFHPVVNSGGPIQLPACPGFGPSTNLGKEFVTWDGSGMKLVADYDYYYNGNLTMRTSPNGPPVSGGATVLFPNGTRYRMEPNNTRWLEDRNGNRITFIYDSNGRVKQIIDPNGRTVSIDVQDEAPYGLHTKITYKGFNGTTRVIRAGYNDLKVWLPDGRAYSFTYNSNSELIRVDLPTGGAYEYDWGGNIPPPTTNCQPPNDVAFRYVTERRIYSNASNLSSKMIFSAPNGMTQVDMYDAANNLVARSKHYFHGNPAPELPPANPHWSYAAYLENEDALKGKEYRTDAYTSNGTLLRMIENTWVTPRQMTWSVFGQPSQTININARVELNKTTLTDVSPNLVAKTEYSYNQGQWANIFFNVLTDTYRYDYGQGIPGAFSSRSHNDYISYDSGSYQNQPYIPLLPSEAWTSSDVGGNNKVSLVRYEYDNYTTVTNHAPLVDRQSITGHNSNCGTGYALRGNATKITRYASAQNQSGALSVYSQYDIAGNIIKSIDARGYATTFDFSDRFGAPDGEARNDNGAAELTGQYTFAFPTLITNALGHTSYTQFDYYLGQAVDMEDANGVVSSVSYADMLDRPTQVIRAANQSDVKSQTTFSYDDTNRTITTSSDQNSYNDNVLVTKVLYDGLGRTVETRQYEGGANYIAVKQQYDLPGHASRSSNPFRPWNSETAVWTTTTLDALNRVVSITTPDGAVTASSYSGNTVTATDQTGKKRKSVTDAFGNLIQVYEDPTGFNYLTSYSYDVTGNLLTVNQGSQTRTFVYDSLKRLTSATNPESGTVNYQYDNNGNLTQKTDARGVTSAYLYDALNRNTTVDYSDTATISPDVTRVYDTATNGKGRLRESFTGGSEAGGTTVEHTKIMSYDALGRPLDQRQRFKSNSVWSSEYRVQRLYNLAGSVTTQIYPSGHTVIYNYDAAGRLGDKDAQNLAFTGNLGDGVNRNYSTEIVYSSFGGPAKEKFGTDIPLYNKSVYNSRGQLSEIRVGTTYTGPTDGGWQRGAIINHYSAQCWGACNGTDNNGNVKQQDHWIPDSSGGVQAIFVQSFAYDDLNRLLRVNEGSNLQQEYVYDRWGNRTLSAAGTWLGNSNNPPNPLLNETPYETADLASSNRLYAPGDLQLPESQRRMRYDAAGNLINDTYTGAGSRVYDAENRMTQAWGGNYQWQYYTYNAHGQRTRRKLDGIETWQIYGFEGELLVEYAANGAIDHPQKEYGYRNGQLLVTAAAGAAGGYAQPVSWTNTVGVSVSGNSLTKTAGSGWSAGAASTQVIAAGDGYVEFSAPTTGDSMIGLSNGDPDQSYAGLDFAIHVDLGNASVWENGVNKGTVGSYQTGDRFRVTVENGVVKYRKNGTLLYTSTASPTYPLLVDTSLYMNGSTLTNVIISSGSAAGAINWLVADQLGTPRMVFDESGSLETMKRHDYLPFGEELFAGVGNRTIALGYTGDSVRQQFTQYERDNETALDFAQARYYSSIEGRFTSVDPLMASGRPSGPQTWNRYSYGLNNPLKYIDPSGLYSVDIDTDQNERREKQQRQQPAPGLPPPPGGPVAPPGPIKIDIGPVPLPEGEVAWPTTLEIVENPNQVYQGDPLVSPSGTVIDPEPNYGVGRTVDYIVRDQSGNPMTTDVLLKEEVKPTNPDAIALWSRTDVQKQPQRPDQNGIVPDTLGLVSRNPASLTYLERNPNVNATFSQTLTVYGTFGQEFRTAIKLQNYYTLTNSGVTITRSKPVSSPRPTN